MALQGDGLVWEFRTAGSNDNGGGFYDRDPGTSVDYSQQAAAELILSDLACTGAALSSTTGGFTAAMKGNILYIKSGTGFTVGWYEITAYTDTNNVTLDRSAGASGSGGTGSVGGARALFIDTHFEAFVAGNIGHAKNDGAYTAVADINVAKDGTTALPMQIRGYNTSRGDNPTGDNRPLLANGAYLLQTDRYWHWRNFRCTTTHASGWQVGLYSVRENCKVHNTSVTAGRSAIRAIGSSSLTLDCEGISDSGAAMYTGTDAMIIGCYFHDSLIGVYVVAATSSIVNNIIDTCTTGILLANNYLSAINNTIYNCGIGVDLGANRNRSNVINNIIDTCTTGLRHAGTEQLSNHIDYNNWNNNTTDVSTATKGDNATANDPSFTDATNGDFATSAFDANATPKTTFPGGLTDNALMQGCVQLAAGGGSVERSSVTIS